MSRRQRLDADMVRRGLVPSQAQRQGGRSTPAGAGQRIHRRQAGAARRPGRRGRAAGPTAALRQPRRRQARCRTRGLRHRRQRAGGCSTPARRRAGFTDCLLQRGAAHVVAVDVGHGQLHPRIRNDQRVDGARAIPRPRPHPATIGGAVDFVVADLSFISIIRCSPPLIGCVPPAWRTRPAGQTAVRGRQGRGRPRAAA